MAMYRNPQAAMNVLSGGPPAPEEVEIADRIMKEGLSSVAQAGAPQQSVPMPLPPRPGTGIPIPPPPRPEQSIGGESEKELLERMMRSTTREKRSEWVLKNENEPLPWNPDSTWGEYLGKIGEIQGGEAVDTLIDEQIKKEIEEPSPKQENEGMPVLPSAPMMPPAGTLEASAAPVAEQGGIMAAANGGLVRFQDGGLNESPPKGGIGDDLMDLAISLATSRKGEEATGADVEKALKEFEGLTDESPEVTKNMLKRLNYIFRTDTYPPPRRIDEVERNNAYYMMLSEKGFTDAEIRELATNPSGRFAPYEPLTDEKTDPPRFNLGGLNETPAAPVGEEEFMALVSQATEEAGVPDEAVNMVADVATQTTGGPTAANDNVMDSGIMQNVEAVDATEEDVAGIGSLVDLNAELVGAGEEGLIHASPGEIVFDPNLLPENERNMLFAALQAEGIDPQMLTVGSDNNPINEMTGLPAFILGKVKRFVKKTVKSVGRAVKKVGSFLKKNAGTILGIAGAMTGNPWLAALGSGVGGLIEGKPLQSALVSAGMSFAGTKWVGPWVSKQLQGIGALGIGDALKTPIGNIAGDIPGSIGTSAQNFATEGLALGALEKGAAQKAAEVALAEGATETAIKTAALNALTEGAKASPQSFLQGLSTDALNTAADKITSNVIADVTSKALTNPLAAQAVETGLGSFAQKALAAPVANVIGGVTSGALQSYATPMVEAAISGIPGESEEDVLAAFNAQYNFAPTADQLYQFYTTEYVPNQQVNVASTIGNLPGYSNANVPAGLNITSGSLPGGIIAAAGGGYINGVGGPKSDSNLARLSDGEFVMTEAAVRGAGKGDRMEGARQMYQMMEGLERRVA
jgi:hypothetical protein